MNDENYAFGKTIVIFMKLGIALIISAFAGFFIVLGSFEAFEFLLSIEEIRDLFSVSGLGVIGLIIFLVFLGILLVLFIVYWFLIPIRMYKAAKSDFSGSLMQVFKFNLASMLFLIVGIVMFIFTGLMVISMLFLDFKMFFIQNMFSLVFIILGLIFNILYLIRFADWGRDLEQYHGPEPGIVRTKNGLYAYRNGTIGSYILTPLSLVFGFGIFGTIFSIISFLIVK